MVYPRICESTSAARSENLFKGALDDRSIRCKVRLWVIHKRGMSLFHKVTVHKQNYTQKPYGDVNIYKYSKF